MNRILRSRFGGLLIFYFVFLTITSITRVALLLQAAGQLDFQPVIIVATVLCGILFDIAAASYISIPLVLLLMMMSRRWLASRLHRWMSGVGFAGLIYVLLFGAVAEWFFWDEFSARFNFIAVDYLIYTTEVIGNIRESYPLPLVFGGLAALTVVALVLLWKTGWLQKWFAVTEVWTNGRKPALLWLALPLVLHLVLSNQRVPEFGNAYNQELARNGLYSFFAALRDNSLNYDRFYPTLPTEDAFRRIKPLLDQPQQARANQTAFDISRAITNSGPERKWNIIQITVESLSAQFLGRFGDTNNLTPYLDRICDESLVFTNFYATGTRTVRGMEALTLCLPPTPGQSIVRRPHNENLFSVGALFRTRGYDTAFVYSGYGYFDNMNAFFAANGYRVLDRSSVAKTDITYATIWGACDEDLFRWTMREADGEFSAGKPFHQFVMTTSNHRPYGFPDGCIDLPTGHREGAVKYTDYAIGKFLETARAKPWFTNTLFVIVGDHCASAAGKTALPIAGYHVPAIIWNPTLVRPRKVGALCCQMDLLPTIFGIMGWNYESHFFGKDILRMTPTEERACIATYQRLGYRRDGKLAVLEPVRRQRMFTFALRDDTPVAAADDPDFMDEAIAEYQTASYLFAHGLYYNTNAK
jgi:phosphoglycerol transferase MdoB-like AlkP superfamily enzyme